MSANNSRGQKNLAQLPYDMAMAIGATRGDREMMSAEFAEHR